MVQRPSGELLLAQLDALASVRPAKRATSRFVQIPAALANLSGELATCVPACLACNLQLHPPKMGIGKQTLRGLANGRGLSLRLYLTMLRWARPYAKIPGGIWGVEGEEFDAWDAEGTWQEHYQYNATVQLPMGALIQQSFRSSYVPVIMDRAHDPDDKAARDGIRRLEGLVEVLHKSGRANTYIPHRVGVHTRVPQTLWRNGWLDMSSDGTGLSGAAVLLLIALLGQAFTPPDRLPGWKSASSPIRQMVTRSGIVQPRDLVDSLPFAPRTNAAALDELTRLDLVAETRMGKGEKRILMLLDPGLLRTAPFAGRGDSSPTAQQTPRRSARPSGAHPPL